MGALMERTIDGDWRHTERVTVNRVTEYTPKAAALRRETA